MNGIDRAIGIAEPHGSMALPFTLERVISKPWYRARSREAFNAHEVYPESKLRTMCVGTLVSCFRAVFDSSTFTGAVYP